MKKIFLPFVFLLISSFAVFSQSRQTINLNQNWQFTPGYEVRNNVFTEISLPHTWNLDALSGKQDYYRGFGNYRKVISVSEAWIKIGFSSICFGKSYSFGFL